MPVDCRDHRRRVVVDREKSLRQRGDEAPGVVGSTIGESAQVDTGREGPTGTGDDDRALDAVHRGDDDLEQVEVEGIHRRVVEPDNRHAIGCFEICHESFLPPGLPRRHKRPETGAFGPAIDNLDDPL